MSVDKGGDGKLVLGQLDIAAVLEGELLDLVRRKRISDNIESRLTRNLAGKCRELIAGINDTDRGQRKEIDGSVFIKFGF